MSAVIDWLQAVAVALGLAAAPGGPVYYGYVEGEFVYLAPRAAGVITEVAVSEGERIAAGDLVFRLDDAHEAAALEAAKARLAEAEALARDKEMGGRTEEIAAAEAELAEAEATRDLARQTFERSEELVARGVVTAAKIDADRASLKAAEAAVRRHGDMLAMARLPARAEQIAAARRAVDAARAAVAEAEAGLADRAVRAPEAGLIDRVFLDRGEHAAAGAAVVSLLPPANLKVRFFVPEPERVGLSPGDRVLIGCSACAQPIPARITRLAAEAEHTPPVIYSREERARLVFAVEARPDQAAGLAPGQPVEVRRAP